MIQKEKEVLSKSTDPKIKAGEQAEKQMSHYLERAFGRSEKVWVFHDLRFELDGADAVQMDHLILYKYGIIIIESKSVSTEVRINEFGEWERKYRGWKGMRSPIKQAERQAEALRKLLDDNVENLLNKLLGKLQKRFGNFSIRSLVAISDQGRISGSGRKDVESQIKKADQICDEITAIMKRRKRAESIIGQATASWDDAEYGNLSETEMTAIGNYLLELHTPRSQKSSAVADRQRARETTIEEAPVVPLPQTAAVEVATGSAIGPNEADAAQTCPKCDAPMVLRTAKKGENKGNQFYGCSRYPKCRSTKSVE